MNRIVITGADGFLGGHLAAYFAEQGCSVIGVSRRSASPSSKCWFSKFLEISSPDFVLLLKEFAPHVVIHAAGGASVPASLEAPEKDFSSGPQLVVDLLGALRTAAPSAKVVFLSSAAVYGNPATLPISESFPPAPISPYGYHKWMAELAVREYAQLYGISGASLRIFSAYGRGLRKQVVWDLCKKAAEEGSLLVRGSGSESRDFVHVDDVCRAVDVLLKNAPLAGECYNFGSGEETRIGEIAEWVAAAANCGEDVKFDGLVSPGMPARWRADISQIQALGWNPTVMPQDGLQDFIHWCLAELRQSTALQL